jgi:hypothetical protein
MFSKGLFFIPTIHVANDVELLILQDVNNKLWKFVLTDAGKDKIDNDNLHQSIKFYVSLKDKPNFLLNIIECTLAQLSTGYSKSFSSQYENNLDSVDITTLKIFNSYGKLLNV